MKAGPALVACLALSALPVFAAPPWLESTTAQLEYAFGWSVAGMPAGNLSGLARCAGELRTLSDRDDGQLYDLAPYGIYLTAAARPFRIAGLLQYRQPFMLNIETALLSRIRGGQYDFEGLDCDSQGNQYLVSETYAAVLRITPDGTGRWLQLPDNLFAMAQQQGLLKKPNALLEGIAVAPDGQQLWLAAERESRGIIHLVREGDAWVCASPCVLLSEDETWTPRPGVVVHYQDFSGMSFYRGRLFTLERRQRQICRREPRTGALQRCWSLHQVIKANGYEAVNMGGAEGLVIEDGSAWLGFDNGQGATPEKRTLILQLHEPADGWLAP